MIKYSLKDFDRDFPTDDACLEWLFNAKYPQGVFCPKCQKTTKHYHFKGQPFYSCEYCGNHIHPLTGTIFEGTRYNHLRLRFKALSYMAVTRCGISSRQLSRDLGISVKTGYRMWHEIRTQLQNGNPIKFVGKVEVDETYIGGKAKGKRGRGAGNKTVVMGMVEREGRVRAMVIPDTKTNTLTSRIENNVEKDKAIVYTDDYPSYNNLEKLGFDHRIIEHSKKIYVCANDIHTNNVEGFWSQLKRSIDGTYHHVTPEHLQEYIDEYSFRFNHRKDSVPMFITMLEKVVCSPSTPLSN